MWRRRQNTVVCLAEADGVITVTGSRHLSDDEVTELVAHWREGRDEVANALQRESDENFGIAEGYAKALRQIVSTLGPAPAGCSECCEGCNCEMDEALRIASEALDVPRMRAPLVIQEEL